MTGSKSDSGVLLVSKKEIPGFPGYLASIDGGIFSTRSGQLKRLSVRAHKGYLHVNIRSGYGRRTVVKKPIHQLVLLAFVGRNTRNQCLTRHLNGNPFDNNVTNLAWGTAKENTADSIRHGTAACLRVGESATAAKLTDEQVLAIEGRAKLGERQSQLAQEFGISQKHVSDIKLHRTRLYLW